jgi:hypothetical protein
MTPTMTRAWVWNLAQNSKKGKRGRLQRDLLTGNNSTPFTFVLLFCQDQSSNCPEAVKKTLG